MTAALYRLSSLHDLSHVVCCAAERCGVHLTGASATEFQQQQMLAVYRYQQKRYELSRLSELFETEGIPFLPLKGSVLSEYYPAPWMRTSCDIDILVKKEDLSRAIDALTGTLSYRRTTTDSHDVSLFSPDDRVHLELHFDLVEEGRAMQAPEILCDVWSAVQTKEGSRFCYVMPDALFYFYHIAHMAKHLERGGGCGMRSFLDLWVLEHCVGHDKAAREELLLRGGLLPFASKASALTAAWFGDAPMTEESEGLLEFILRGAAYGSTTNRVEVGQATEGGRASYLWSRIFVRYDVLKYRYPVLQKHRWLLPLMQVRRWCSLPFRGRMRRMRGELRAHRRAAVTKGEGVDVLSVLGLREAEK
jgi:hypothetical protein